MKQINYTIGAFAIITDRKGRVLLSHRLDYDIWNLPGGGMDKNETPEMTVIREVKEETSLIVEVQQLSGVYVKPGNRDMAFVFKCKVVGGKLKPSKEADQHSYFGPNEIPINTIPNHVQRIRNYYKSKKKTHWILQAGTTKTKDLHKYGLIEKIGKKKK